MKAEIKKGDKVLAGFVNEGVVIRVYENGKNKRFNRKSSPEEKWYQVKHYRSNYGYIHSMFSERDVILL